MTFTSSLFISKNDCIVGLSIDSVIELNFLRQFLAWFCLWEKRSLVRTRGILDQASHLSGRDLKIAKYTKTELTHGFFTTEVTEDLKALFLGVILLVEDFTSLPHILDKKWKVII